MQRGPDYAAQPRGAPGLGDVVARLLGETRSLVSDYAELAVLDARRAAIRLAWLLGTGLVIAVLAVTAWIALVAAGIVWLLGSGVSWIGALAIAAALNVVAAAALAWWGRKTATEMPFTELLRQLRGAPPRRP